MIESLTQLGVGGILSLLIIREVLNFLSKRKNNHKFGNPIDFETLYRRVGDLHEWQEGLRSHMDRQERLLKDSLECLRRIESHYPEPLSKR